MKRRFGINKGHSARKFKRQVQRTKTANINRSIMRGGWRL